MGLSIVQVLPEVQGLWTLLCEEQMVWEDMKAKMKASLQSVPIKKKHTFLLNAILSLRALFLDQANDGCDPLYWSTRVCCDYIQIIYLLFSSLQLFAHTLKSFSGRTNVCKVTSFLHIFPSWLGIAPCTCYFPSPIFSTCSDLHLLMAQFFHHCHCVCSCLIYDLHTLTCPVI